MAAGPLDLLASLNISPTLFSVFGLLSSLQIDRYDATAGGKTWHCLHVQTSEGNGPDNVGLQVAWSDSDTNNYRLSSFSHHPTALRWAVSLPGHVRFDRLEVYRDFGDSKTQGPANTFASVLWVGHGVERGTRVTYVWPGDYGHARAHSVLLKVYDGDARNLGRPSYRTLVEHARVEWLSAEDRPAGLAGFVERMHRWVPSQEKFLSGSWRKSTKRRSMS